MHCAQHHVFQMLNVDRPPRDVERRFAHGLREGRVSVDGFAELLGRRAKNSSSQRSTAA